MSKINRVFSNLEHKFRFNDEKYIEMVFFGLWANTLQWGEGFHQGDLTPMVGVGRHSEVSLSLLLIPLPCAVSHFDATAHVLRLVIITYSSEHFTGCAIVMGNFDQIAYR